MEDSAIQASLCTPKSDEVDTKEHAVQVTELTPEQFAQKVQALDGALEDASNNHSRPLPSPARIEKGEKALKILIGLGKLTAVWLKGTPLAANSVCTVEEAERALLEYIAFMQEERHDQAN